VRTETLSPSPVPEDEALRDRFRSGDRAAFDEVVTRHRRMVYLMALRVLGRHEDADEAAQQTFVRAWKACRRFRGDASIRTWLVRIVLNVSRTMRARRPDHREFEPETASDPACGAEERIRREQLRRRVRTAVDRLPPRQREVVLLKVFGEMTYREVARTMELSEGAVKAHLHQAVSNLRRLMGELDAEEVR
jgi:RNA polymerase sigma-70 factor (ECF subfamily)